MTTDPHLMKPIENFRDFIGKTVYAIKKGSYPWILKKIDGKLAVLQGKNGKTITALRNLRQP